jgi:trans-aconitate methyltransferase
MAATEQQTFYDQHPFDWVPTGASEDIRSVVSAPLVDLIDALDPHSLVLDVGCGPSIAAAFLSAWPSSAMAAPAPSAIICIFPSRTQQPML